MKLEYQDKGIPNPSDTKLRHLVTQPINLYKTFCTEKEFSEIKRAHRMIVPC